MLCEHCHKSEATVHIQEIVDGKKTSLNLCQPCAVAKGMPTKKAAGMDLATLIYNLTAQAVGDTPIDNHAEAAPPELTCEHCGQSSAAFRKTGRLGCANCYQTFADLLLEAFEEMHRGNVHCGKQPAEAAIAAPPPSAPPVEATLALLAEELSRAIAAEAYERAAEIRDQISLLREGRQSLQYL